jgi:hypothetical protein
MWMDVPDARPFGGPGQRPREVHLRQALAHSPGFAWRASQQLTDAQEDHVGKGVESAKSAGAILDAIIRDLVDRWS